MKKITIVLILLMLEVSLFAQTNNDVQRIIGTWKSPDNITIIFNADGTFSQGGISGRYFVMSGKLITTTTVYDRSINIIYNMYISSNGKILFLESSSSNLWYDKQ